jgi:rod shape-determining protein MreD
MNSQLFVNIFRFFLLVLLQAAVLNNINFLGYINPYVYILFIILLPVNIGRGQVIFYSFLLGLCIDFFADSGGINAAACLVIAYFRPLILKSSFGLGYDYQTLKFTKISFKERLVYVSTMVLIHHFVLFSLETFNFLHILSILKKTLFSGIFSVILILIAMVLFGKRGK